MSSSILVTTKASQVAFLASGSWCVASDTAESRQFAQALKLPVYPISNGHRNPEMGTRRPEE